jgi:hypothetical protein
LIIKSSLDGDREDVSVSAPARYGNRSAQEKDFAIAANFN